MHKLSKALTFIGALLALTFCAVSCKTDDDDDPTMYTVTVSSSIEHGKVTADKSSAEAGATIKLTAKADSGYELDSYSVKDEKSNTIPVTKGTFTMPKSNVTVSATFKETAETVNQKAAAAVIAKITAIGTVVYTDESKAKIDDARAAYNVLTGVQKELVPEETLNLLTAAETKYAELKAAADSGTANQNAADAVIAKITAIGTVAYTSESKAKIDDARKAYDALTEAQKKLVPEEKLALLTAAETKYSELKAAADSETANQNAANAVIAKITAIGTVTYTSESKAKIDEARTAYEELTGAQKALIPAETLSVLTAAEASYNSQKATADKANAVIAKITAIGTVAYTSESKAKIDEARTAYDALTEAQKALIPAETLAVLTNAESTYGTLKAAAEQQTATYTVKIASGIANGTVTASPTSATAGTEITLTASPSTGYQFVTFTVTDADGKAVTVTDNKFTMPASNVTVSATFTALPPATASYTVKHLQQNIADDNYTLKESETKTGTVGQPTAASAKSYDGFTAQTVTQVTVAANGTEVEIKYNRNTYTVTFNANGGSDVSSQPLRYGATATKPADPTKTATTTTKYTFDGWYSDSGLTASFSFGTAITENITLYAKWNETALYTVTLTGGANATISGGNTTQEGLSNAMETVTFTANDGYYFEDFTDITSNGITATRTSDSVVTVSGTPTGNASITIPDATEQQATTYSITLTGPYSNFTLVMEYQEGDTWNDMATKYPDYIKIYSNKWLGFHTDGLIYDKAAYKKVSPTDVIDPNKTYEIQ